ncbi:MAG: hypothetical protein LBR55_04915 [Bacteroidales bacterium]|jgi:hypothetical protein|nr:hypothetical protein [Bacteroidales bacterium]
MVHILDKQQITHLVQEFTCEWEEVFNKEKSPVLIHSFKLTESIKHTLEEAPKVYAYKENILQRDTDNQCMKQICKDLCRTAQAKCYLNKDELIISIGYLYKDSLLISKHEKGIYITKNKNPKLYREIDEELKRQVIKADRGFENAIKNIKTVGDIVKLFGATKKSCDN